MLLTLLLLIAPQDSGVPLNREAPRPEVVQPAVSQEFTQQVAELVAQRLAELAAEGESAETPVGGSSLWSRLSFDAAGRVRAAADIDRPGLDDRYRGRMRFRVGAHFQLDEAVSAHARLSTASEGGDANNPNWDFGDGAEGFNGGDVVLDRFYLNWRATERLELRAGQFQHVYTTVPVAGEFLWDADVQPAGVAATWNQEGAGQGDFSGDLRLAEYIAVEVTDDNEPTMFGVQGNLYAQLDAETRLHLAGSYSLWSNLERGVGTFANEGNTDVGGDFEILDLFAVYDADGGPWGGTELFCEYINNLGDDQGEDTGVVLGGLFGPTGSEGDLSLFASWYDVDANAVFSPVSQNDTPIFGTGAGTGMSGVIVGGQYYVSDILRVKVWGLTSDIDADEDPYRLRLDFDCQVR